MPDVGTYHGLAGLEKGTREFLTAWEQVGMHAHEFIEAGDKVVVLATARGRGKGSGVEADGVRARLDHARGESRKDRSLLRPSRGFESRRAGGLADVREPGPRTLDLRGLGAGRDEVPRMGGPR